MFVELVDRYCRDLPGSQIETPFGPETLVWTVGGRMFAIHTDDGNGVSVARPTPMDGQALVQTGKAVSPPYLKGAGWVLLPYDRNDPDELRQRLQESYDHVRVNLPSEVELTLPPGPGIEIQ